MYTTPTTEEEARAMFAAMQEELKAMQREARAQMRAHARAKKNNRTK